MDKHTLEGLIAAAIGDEPADLLITNAQVVNVFTGSIEHCSVSVKNGYIAALHGLDESVEANDSIDLQGKYLIPGFIDAHVHPESSMLEPARWSEEIVPLGTVAVVADPHEIANVLGVEGIRFMVERSAGLPLSIFFMIPSCVPATHMETSGAVIGVEEMKQAASLERVIGMAEMMNFPGVTMRFEDVMEKILWAENSSLPIDGHAPMLSGRALAAYRAAGIRTDHECLSVDEALEKVAMGMKVLIREGSAARNLETLIEAVTPSNSNRFMFCTDDRHPLDLKRRGHMNNIVNMAIGKGVEPIDAIRMATINTAEHYGLSRMGAIAPGYLANLVVSSSIEQIVPETVFIQGKVVAQDGKAKFEYPEWVGKWPNRFSLPEVSSSMFEFSAVNNPAPVIGVVPGQIITEALSHELKVDESGLVQADPERDLLKLCVLERYTGNGGRACAMVKGFGLKHGAIATSVAHDSHNVIVVGVDDESMASAVSALANSGGGLAVSNGNRVEYLALPIAGLMTYETGDVVRSRIEELLAFASKLGCKIEEPFMQLAFLALPVIPSLKLTDKGLVDVNSFSFIDAYRFARP